MKLQRRLATRHSKVFRANASIMLISLVKTRLKVTEYTYRDDGYCNPYHIKYEYIVSEEGIKLVVATLKLLPDTVKVLKIIFEKQKMAPVFT